jgi:molecular chaperone DnaK (HSP70)
VDLGIDFGTTRTVVACADRGNHPVVGFSDAAGDSTPWIPTVAAERAGSLRFGFDAMAVANDASWALLRSFKRLLSSPQARPEQPVAIGSSEVQLGRLVAGFVEHVREALLGRSDVRRAAGRASSLRTAIAVPANAHGAQRLITLDAFRQAGLDVAAMLNEPSAAGFEYTHRHRDTLSSKRDAVVVYDLGGGTFDSSVVRMSGRHHEVLATAGVASLGGDDFDTVLANLVLDRLGLAPTALPERSMQSLLDRCRAAKEALSPTSRKITIDLEGSIDQTGRPEVTLAVTDFYDACAPLVDRTIEVMLPIMSRMDDEAAWADVAGVYVVGGASELPIVARALRQRFGRRVHRSPYPSAAVAIGLSIAAHAPAGFELVDRYSRVFGVFRENEGGREITYDPIFTPETRLPSDRESVVCTRRYRAAHNVGHFRFFECSGLEPDGRPRGDMAVHSDVYFPFDGRARASADLASLPIERNDSEGPEVVERYTLDEKGIVDVLIRDVDSGYEKSYRLGRTYPMS